MRDVRQRKGQKKISRFTTTDNDVGFGSSAEAKEKKVIGSRFNKLGNVYVVKETR